MVFLQNSMRERKEKYHFNCPASDLSLNMYVRPDENSEKLTSRASSWIRMLFSLLEISGRLFPIPQVRVPTEED
jgi:hypothetical protein